MTPGSDRSPELHATAARVGVVVTFDIGPAMVSGPLTSANLPAVHVVDRDPRYFDAGMFRPLAQVGPTVSGTLTGYKVDGSAIGAGGPGTGLAGAHVVISTYVHDFGFGAVLAIFHLVGTVDTDGLLLAANHVADPAFAATLDRHRTWSTQDAIAAARAAVGPHFSDPRTSLCRRYSLVHIVELDAQLLSGLRTGETIYSRYEREFHALSVRVIANWRERYPEGCTFTEQNASVAPSGVLRFNARNVLMYEHPYSATEVESLFYPALVELRLWEIMASVELLELRTVIASVDRLGDRDSLRGHSGISVGMMR